MVVLHQICGNKGQKRFEELFEHDGGVLVPPLAKNPGIRIQVQNDRKERSARY